MYLLVCNIVGMPIRVCGICNKSFKQKAHYEYHINRKIKCEYSKKSEIITDIDPENENIGKNSKTPKGHKCIKCGKVFSSNSNLHRHTKKQVCYNKHQSSIVEKLKNDFDDFKILITKKDKKIEMQNAIILSCQKENKKLKEKIKHLESRSENPVVYRKVTKTPKHKKKKIPKGIRNIVWDTHMGADYKRGLCCCCKIEQITFVNFHCGHIISECNGGEVHVNNLIPICQSCNCSMGSMNLEDYKEGYGLQ